jgi:anti-sigma B factor antagonist
LNSHFRVEVNQAGSATVLTLSGELDLSSSPALEEELERTAGADSVVVDLRGLEFIDSTGLSVLVKAHQEAQDSGREFGLVKGGAQVQRLLDLTGLTERLTLADAPEELLRDG